MNIAQVCAYVPAWNSIWNWIAGLNWVEQGLLATATAIGGFATAWKLMLEFFKWWRVRYDEKILDLFRDSLREVKFQNPGRSVTIAPIPLADIAEAIRRSESSVLRSLRRLEARAKVQEVQTGWILHGEQPRFPPHVHRL